MRFGYLPPPAPEAENSCPRTSDSRLLRLSTVPVSSRRGGGMRHCIPVAGSLRIGQHLLAGRRPTVGELETRTNTIPRPCSSGGLMAGRLYRLGDYVVQQAICSSGIGGREATSSVMRSAIFVSGPDSMPVCVPPGQAAKPLGALGDNNRIIRFSCPATRQLLSQRGGRPGGRSVS
jgi:hypothetical protein